MLNIIHLLLFSYTFTHLSKADTKCNPTKNSSCIANDPAFTHTPISVDFTNETNVNQYFQQYSKVGALNYSDAGLNFTLNKRFDNPSIQSKFYLFFGKVEVICTPAVGKGIVSTVYLQSDDLDEVDLEWIGTDTSNVQTNWYSKGNVTTYDRGAYNSLSDSSIDLFATTHNYTIDWTKDSIKWYIDDELVRTLGNSSSEGYPQSPMAIFIGVWAGGDPSNSAGTIQWAGGETDYSDAPFSMLVKSMKIENYSYGTEYSYEGTSGDWEDVEVKTGSISSVSSAVTSSVNSSASSQSVMSSSSIHFISASSLTAKSQTSSTIETSYTSKNTVYGSSSSSAVSISSGAEKQKGQAAALNSNRQQIAIGILLWCLSLFI